ncbi:hypothetical protein [Paraburkholderia tropica]|uniref:hypothetical protein n=1 Tax=Paraburkholderia tropica TaxID=92647 RepID=UPI002AB707AF|nr:hypothetical protein [Paraburkholderia tropica]
MQVDPAREQREEERRQFKCVSCADAGGRQHRTRQSTAVEDTRADAFQPVGNRARMVGDERLVVDLSQPFEIDVAQFPVEIRVIDARYRFPPEIQRHPIIEDMAFEACKIVAEIQQEINGVGQRETLVFRRVTRLFQPRSR